jgi:hypothetical protein
MSRWASILVGALGCFVAGVAVANESPPTAGAPAANPAPPAEAPAAVASDPAGDARPAVAPVQGPPPAPPAAAQPAWGSPAVQLADRDRDRGRAPRQRRKIGLMIAGIGVFAAGYVGAVLSIALSSALYGDAAAAGPELAIPIAGPWIGLSTTDWDSVPSNQRTSAQATMVLQGGLQAVGAVLAGIGISQYVASQQPESERRRFSFQLSPAAGGAFGVIRGTF